MLFPQPSTFGPMASSSGALTIAISGSSGAGKTSLTVLLKQILPPCALYIHADAFGKEFENLPSYNGVLDADSRDSVRFDALRQTVDHAKLHGVLPDIYKSYDFIEADLQKAQSGIRPGFLASMRDEVERSKIDWDAYKTIIVVDGFLLYHDSDLRDRFDIKLLLRTTKEEAKQRRLGRYGEKEVPEDSEEFWKTTPYFHNCVWRNYAKEHAFLFAHGDVEADLDRPADIAGFRIWVQPVPDGSFEETQSWAIETLLRAVSDS